MGRPRSFDTGRALERALRVFWENGYEGTSLSDLTAAMGINRPSLYAAFGTKRELFRKVIERYDAGPAAYRSAALAAPTARDVVERLLRGAIELQTSPRHPGGCLLVQGALSCGAGAAAVRADLAAWRRAAELAIRKRLQRARAEGDLPRDADPADLARYVATVLHGMAVQAAGGSTRAQLERVAATALRAWPAARSSRRPG